MSSNIQYESLWKILREYNFTINELDHADYICVLCQKLLIEAKQAPCACRFCAKCIEEYLSKGNSICPGNTSECNDEILQINENISNDYVTNRKISKLKLKCPSENCTYEDMLSNMNQHLMLCGKPTVACPFSHFGCNQICDDKEEIVKHLQLENYEHSHLMMEMIVNLKNEVGILMKENVLLKSESDKQQKLIENLELKVNEISGNYVNTIDSKSNSFLGDVDNEKNLTLLTDTSSSHDSEDDQDSDDLNESDESDENDDIQIKCKEFSWLISDFSKKQLMKSLDSDVFYTHRNGYKMQLRLLPACRRGAGWYGISIYPNCIKGNYDHYQQWPLKCEITLGIINQRTGFYLKKITRLVSYDNSNKCPVSPFDFPLNDKLSFLGNNLKVKCILQIITE